MHRNENIYFNSEKRFLLLLYIRKVLKNTGILILLLNNVTQNDDFYKVVEVNGWLRFTILYETKQINT